MQQTVREAIDALQNATAVVVTLYAGRNTEISSYASMVEETVLAYLRELADPAALCMSVDGNGPAVDVANAIASRYGASLVVAESNGGKLAALRLGVQQMLRNAKYRYFAAVDQDGDHFANDLLNFVRTAQHASAAVGTENVLVMGERLSLHRPLGYLRGEQETLADAMLMDALNYYAAVNDQPLNLTYLQPLHRYPDFHAGYKVFSRQTAEGVFTSSPELAACGEDAYYRHAIEAVMVVEAHLHGATLASITRRTYDEQPVSMFADFNLTQLTANLILWPCKRLGVPGSFVRQWLSNHLPELLLGTMQPEGRDELLAIQQLVLEGYGLASPDRSPVDIPRPRFI